MSTGRVSWIVFERNHGERQSMAVMSIILLFIFARHLILERREAV